MIRETVSREFSVIVNAKQNSIKKPDPRLRSTLIILVALFDP